MPPEASRFDPLLVTLQTVRSAGGDIDAVLRTIVDSCLVIMPRADGAIVEMRESDELVYRAASGRAARYIGMRLNMAKTFAGRSMKALRPMMCADIEEDDQVDHRPYRDAGMRALISVPLLYRNVPLGALKFYSSQPGAFIASDLIIAQLIASQVVVAIAILAEQAVAQARRTDEARFELITETLPMLIWTMTPAGLITYHNRKVNQLLGSDLPAQLDGKALALVDRADRRLVATEWAAALAQGSPRAFQCRLGQSIGARAWTLVEVLPVSDAGGEVLEWIGVGIDICAYKARERNLQDALDTKELELFEIGHRVRNSLQVVVGLLGIQARRINEPEARQRLLDARAQVSTIAQVHQAIHATMAHGRVEFIAFLHGLAASLGGRDGQPEAKIVFDGRAVLELPVNRGVPAAIIAGEIITNAFKHGGGSRDVVTISISTRIEGDKICLDIADDGPGLPDDFDPEQSTGLGMDIVFSLARQAGGQVDIIPEPVGAHFRLTLPND